MRLIDADELLLNNTWLWYDENGNHTIVGEAIENAPTLDAELVKHGHWISIDGDGDSPYKCSVCGGVKVNENGEWLDICQQEWCKMPYCAVCGAKMDERET